MGARALGPRVLIVVVTIALLAAVYAVGPLGLPVTPDQRPITAKTPDGRALRAPMIVVAPEIVAERAAAIPLLVEVGPPQWVPHDSFLLLQGLPAGAHLSHGERLSADLWSVPVAALPTLAFALPTDAVGRSQVKLRLVGGEGSFLAQAKTVIVIDAPARAAEGRPSAPAKQEKSPSGPQWASGLLPGGGAGGGSPTGSRLPAQAGAAAEPAGSAGDPAPATRSSRAPGREQAEQGAPPLPRTALVAPGGVVVSLSSGAPAPAGTALNGGVSATTQPRAGPPAEERASAVMSAAIGPAAPPPIAAPNVPSIDVAAPRSGPNFQQQSRTNAGTRPYDAGSLVARGESYVAAGNIAAARQFFLRAAEAGSARGALLLAATYDPHELAAAPQVLGVLPNLTLAFSWYRRALELGEILAAERLARLNSSTP